MSKRLSGLLRKISDQGFTTELTSKGHYRILGPDGRLVAYTSGTPSDWRVQRNLIAELRRAGLVWPPR